MPPKADTINALQVLRAAAALLVVVWHSRLAIKYFEHNYWPEGDASYRVLNYPALVNHLDLGVDLFFCISGFIMCMLVEKTDRQPFGAARFIFQRALRIFPPYWFFTSLVLVAYIASSGKFNLGAFTSDLWMDAWRLSKSLLLIPQQSPPVLGLGWTLIHEFIFYLICAGAIALNLSRHLPAILGVLVGASALAAVFDIVLLHGYFPSLFSLEFLAGAVAYRIRASATRFPFVLFSVAIASFWLASEILDYSVEAGLYYLLRPICGAIVGFSAIMSLMALDRAYRLGGGYLGRWMIRIGDASYTLYLSHWFVLSILGKFALGFVSIPALMVMIWHGLSVLACIAIAVVLSERIEIPLHRRLVKSSRFTQ